MGDWQAQQRTTTVISIRPKRLRRPCTEFPVSNVVHRPCFKRQLMDRQFRLVHCEEV